MIMEIKKLGELGEIFIGLTYKPDDVTEDGIVVLRSGNIQDGELDFQDLVRVNCNVKEKLFVKDGDILMCSRNGSARLVGKSAIIKDLPENMTFGAFMTVIRTDKNSYLQYFFKSPYFKRQLKGSATTTINQITRNMLIDVEVPILYEEKSSKIVSILKKTESIIKARKQQLEQLDELIKSQFVEMFGDPVINPKGWTQSTLRQIAKEKLSYGSGASAVEYDGKCRYVRITDITNQGDLSNDIKSPNEYDKKYILNDGDILFARSGATVGKTLLYKKIYGECIYAGYLIRLVPNKELVIPEYVFHYTKTDYYSNFIASNMKVVAQPNINAQQYGDLEIGLPPLELQNQFATFVQQTDKLKFVY